MAKLLILHIFSVLILSGVESCFLRASQDVDVQGVIRPGQYITTVKVGDCASKSMHFVVIDPRFKIYSNGSVEAVVTVDIVSLADSERTFVVFVEDSTGQTKSTEVHLLNRAVRGKRQLTDQGLLKRSKRRWSPPPFTILENDVGPFPKDVEKIVSDSASTQEVYYYINGPGIDLPPVGLFEMDRITGMLSVNGPVDRETYPEFVITTKVFNRVTGVQTDLPLDMTIMIEDVNDNAPTFKDPLQFIVPEKSEIGEIVGMVNSTDRDQRGTMHVKVRYSLLSGGDLFAINPETGIITTRTNTLDREVKDKQTVVVQIKDMNGEARGLSNTGTATITLTDVNDNPPTFSKSSYQATVQENEKDKLILRIPVDDKDLKNTPNWAAKFVITKGDDGKHFKIDTDPKTNEGLLYVTKPLDYEKTPKVNLEIMARNVADLKGTTAKWQTVPVTVDVTNVDEGPEFTAPTVRYPVKENTANGTLIGTYKAVDPETKSSDGIKYYKATDPGSWVNIERDTGEVKVANTIDRESQLVKDGTYTVTVKAVDDTSKTGTGTIILVVEDENDNPPIIPDKELVICEKEGELGSVLVTAEDSDQPPFSSPFSFSLPQNNEGIWSLTRFNETAATLRHLKELPTGIHNVIVEVKDLQGNGKEQTAKVRICQCRNGACLAKGNNVSLGPMGILALLLPLALLLLLGLLLAFFCVTKREKMELEDAGDSGGILLKSNTEAPGEEVDASLITYPTIGTDTVAKGTVMGVSSGWQGTKSTSTMGGGHENGLYTTGVKTNEYYTTGEYDVQYGSQFNGGQMLGSGMAFDSRYFNQDSSFLRTWETNGRYLQQKLPYLGNEDNARFAEDIIHSYGYEGVGSAAGSVGCCSEFGDNDNLDFLNTLGPKFKSLAEVTKKT